MAGMFRSAFTVDDLIDSASIALLAGQYNKLGEYQVQAGEQVGIGYGRESGQENAQGRIYVKLQTSTPAEITGVVRLEVWSPQDHHLRTIAEFRTEALSASTDRTKQIPLPFTNLLVSEDKKIVLTFKPDSGATLSKADSTVQMDITRQYI